MFSITARHYFVYRHPTDMRKSFDGLCGIVTNLMGKNPMSGDLYIFINKSRNKVKMLRWEAGGFVLFYKRLERGTFEIPTAKNNEKTVNINYGQLAMIITGISMKNARKKTRFYPQNTVEK